MNIGESLPRNAQHFPDKPAIVKALKAGDRVENCRLTQGRGLRVKTL